MAAGTQSETADVETERSETPELSVCETAPGKTVFIESDNSDGWLASDTTVDVQR
ncbi:hypothetical protein G9C85_05750 [Halorubellus sp. JP-L1]|uniref:hypothetical protein n=1 Tax=Halorubellus sp. JP-L1 TaxID=2715753 RepID=UPI001408F256|nr:hypothetical protein [Halorubellus sp. JP-L1]NHN41139.1 hypothetical protein [Halorubellus sp. JP-L1]